MKTKITMEILYPWRTRNYPAIWVVFLILSLLTQTGTAAAAPLDLPKWLEELTPKRGDGIHAELVCYALPYGAIGFASHVLTYYTVIILAFGRLPWWPRKRLQHGKWDMVIAIIGVVIGTMFAVFTIVRCRQRWQFLLISVWKTVMTITLGAISIQTGMIVNRQRKKRLESFLREQREQETPSSPATSTQKSEHTTSHTTSSTPYLDEARKNTKEFLRILFWLFLYLPGVIVGLVGLISLVTQHWSSWPVRKTTFIFIGIAGGLSALLFLFFILIGCIEMYDERSEDEPPKYKEFLKLGLGGGFGSGFAAFLSLVGLLGAFYSDWVLAALAGNITGVPSRDHSWLYYGFFLSKRLPMFSF
ncbi:hypothetical protein EX30DRAFT_334424 [Ascodesmis nigricans]|uniref:Uncharacterized protein n=1 Tax=Ascodesmis nigricans TaxID=341454 RepID=A0A4S2MS73_9PEZI|nr:hypothetical protein EX30DRAFT_334424 [Ascodesmis nigricans]